MSLAIFDLDNTLIAGDSDHLWGEFIVERGLVPAVQYRQQNDQFYADYKKGTLDIIAYLNFALAPLATIPTAELKLLHNAFMLEKIQPIVLPKAQALIQSHRDAGDELLIITATNRFITEPIANTYGITHILASEPEIIDGQYTGRTTGVPCYQDGKITRLKEWLIGRDCSLVAAHFYSDSINDLPLLNFVENPVAVDPDDRLKDYAQEHGIPIISLR